LRRLNICLNLNGVGGITRCLRCFLDFNRRHTMMRVYIIRIKYLRLNKV
jgi:hypothetical protein